MKTYKEQLDKVLNDFLSTVEFKKGSNAIENAIFRAERQVLMEGLISNLQFKCDELLSLDSSISKEDLIEYVGDITMRYSVAIK